MTQYAKNRTVGGFSVYRAGYGEGLMLFTNNKEHDDMIPVWVSRFVANQIKKSVELSEKEYWEIHTLRFAFLDDILDFYNPVDAYCPECHRRVHAGVRQLDNNYPIYYAICRHEDCGWSLEGGGGDYDAYFYYRFPEQMPEDWSE